MNTERNCQSCKYYKDGYCENLDMIPCYPKDGCSDFENKRMGNKEWIDFLCEQFEQGDCNAMIELFALPSVTTMRDATPEEQKSVNDYIKSISTPTGVKFDDAISREELLKAIETWDKFGCDADTKLVRYQDHYVPYIHYDDVIKCIKGMPSVTQKSGKWIDYRDDGFVECPFCGHATNCEDDIDELHYCFYCGAKMESEE